MNKGIIGSIVLGVVIIIGLIVGFSCAEKVPAGYVGIQYDMRGGVSDDLLTQGWHLVAPTKEVTLYSVGIEQSYLTAGKNGDSKDDDSFEVPSSDGKGLKVDLTFTYRYDTDRVAELFTKFRGQSGKEIRDTFIKPNIISWTKEVTAKYPVTEILGDERANLNVALTEYIREKFDAYGIIVENVSLIDIDADDETRASVQRKVNAQQEMELAQIEQKTAKIQAEKDREVASINAEKAKIQAQGEADAIIIKAEAEAEANKKLAQSLTPELLEKAKYDKWNGELPMISGSAGTIIDMGAVNSDDEQDE